MNTLVRESPPLALNRADPEPVNIERWKPAESLVNIYPAPYTRFRRIPADPSDDVREDQ
jgi:hypothetical protein